MKDKLPKRIRDPFLTPIWMLAPQGSGFQSPYRPNESERKLRPPLERHLAKSLDLLGMKAAFDEHIEILVALLLGRELDSEFA
jgi:hypothetical protein